ncbi:MAG: PQQ-binding-like beta-propeller repeat protein [Deltaproteobacteria bacterium]|nr:PQQ-binding-like beta-propeller repeat protein [Deltaproteobacteria bacterium]
MRPCGPALVVLALLSCSQSPNAQPIPARASASPPATLNPQEQRGWMAFRGDAAHTGRAGAAGPRAPDLRWTFATGGRICADAAVAEDGTVYAASHDHRLYAIGKDGRQLWSYDAGGKIWTSPVIGKDGTIYVGSDDDRLAAVDASGKERWVFVTTEPAARGDKPEDGRWDVDTSPVLAADGTVVFGCNRFLYALFASGVLRWKFEAGLGRVKVFTSPAVGRDGTIFFGTQGRSFHALTPIGAAGWKLSTDGDNDGSPSVGDDGTVYFGSDDGRLRAVAPGGTLRFATDLGGPIRAPAAIARDGTVYASTYGPRPFLAALDGRTGAVRWRFHIEPGDGDLYGIESGALVDADGYVYFGGRDRYVYCLTPEGALAWRFLTGGQVDAGPVLGPDGTLYVGSDDGKLYAFR